MPIQQFETVSISESPRLMTLPWRKSKLKGAMMERMLEHSPKLWILLFI
ncbi:unnamed protein product [Cylicostephanus goldi]|uniref:Uncharacterized protein n=1 Tax=Cylicostephanus goldi TaxID=71465 RepID=A0A3P6R9C3_CYLGO|nr:unnamed protein product [Cylicostephanus goldi]